MKIYGSNPSPFARRTRLLLMQAPGAPKFEFLPLDIYSSEGRNELRKFTPVLKIPVLVDGDITLLDSRVIFNYVCKKGWHAELNWSRQNLLTVIDGVADSLVNLILLKRSGVELTADSPLGRSHFSRIEASLAELERASAQSEFAQWDYPAICLYTTLDWAQFRKLWDFQNYPALKSFLGRFADRVDLKSTDPRNVS